MKIYVIGGHYLRTQDEAKTRAKELGLPFNPSTDIDEVPTDAKGLIAYLNDLVQGLAAGPRAAPAADALPLHSNAMIDETFEELPITHQLTLTCLALENARARIIELEEGHVNLVLRGSTRAEAETDFIDTAKTNENFVLAPGVSVAATEEMLEELAGINATDDAEDFI